MCHPSPPPIYALKDVFGRFGNLIDIYMLNGKTFGYAKYSSKDSADKAIVVSTGCGGKTCAAQRGKSGAYCGH